MAKLFQHQTLGDLMAGFFDGSMTIEALLKEGNYGIGTMDHLDGELIVIDGKAYQAKENGELVVLKGDETVPYAAVTDFTPDQTFTVNELISCIPGSSRALKNLSRALSKPVASNLNSSKKTSRVLASEFTDPTYSKV